MTRTSILVALLLCVAGCATTYHKAPSFSLFDEGGYWQLPGPGELVNVGFAGTRVGIALGPSVRRL